MNLESTSSLFAIFGDHVNDVSRICLLGIILNFRLTFEKYIHSMFSTMAKKDRLTLEVPQNICFRFNCNQIFNAFILSHFEFCAPVWMSAADCHLKLHYRAINSIQFISPSLVLDLDHQHQVGALSILFNIFKNNQHLLHNVLSDPLPPARVTRFAFSKNNLSFNPMNICMAILTLFSSVVDKFMESYLMSLPFLQTF